jgi:Poly(ADP-ribose) polymerase and DNA-Ligase Zn-finger region
VNSTTAQAALERRCDAHARPGMIEMQPVSTRAPTVENGRLRAYSSSVAHVFETAPTGRSKCRGCARLIERGELRFGERVPNLFAEGETTLWFHPLCAAYKRPQTLLDALEETGESVQDRENLKRAALASVAHPRVSRIDGAERSPSSQAKCRHCHEPIERGSWRIRIVYYEEGRFSPGGYIHLGCRKAYFETDEVRDPVLRFSAALSDAEREELGRSLTQ